MIALIPLGWWLATVLRRDSTENPKAVAKSLEQAIAGVTRTRVIDGAVELYVKGVDRLVPRVVSATEDAGSEVLDLSVTEPSLETELEIER